MRPSQSGSIPREEVVRWGPLLTALGLTVAIFVNSIVMYRTFREEFVTRELFVEVMTRSDQLIGAKLDRLNDAISLNRAEIGRSDIWKKSIEDRMRQVEERITREEGR